jgi:hypothetical protein
MQTRLERIAERRAQIPRQFRKVYDIAMAGRSLRAAVNSQCIECMGYVFSEVRLCCSPQCPLFPYRPLRGVSYGVSGVGQSGAESKGPEQGGIE